MRFSIRDSNSLTNGMLTMELLSCEENRLKGQTGTNNGSLNPLSWLLFELRERQLMGPDSQ